MHNHLMTITTGPTRALASNSWLTAVLLLAAFMISGTSESEHLVDEQIRFYSISGNSASEIRANLDKNSPIILHGKRFDASTDSDIQWTLRMRIIDDKCQLEQVSTHVALLFTLPELTLDDTGADYLNNRWNRYYQALVRHEEGHALIALRAARQIELTLGRLSDAPDCEVLESTANKLANEILLIFETVNRRFDEKTMHGALDGAIFPNKSLY